jgi:hypothetical protein
MVCLYPWLSITAESVSEPNAVYLFSYFVRNGEDGLHLAWSEDGLTWNTLNDGKAYLPPEVGKSKLMRDPSIVQGPDGTYHMVWTAGWGELGIGYAHSQDLRTWSEQKYLPVMAHEPTTQNAWAPELFYDSGSGQFLIIWSSTELPDNDHNHRMYYTTTRDFETFTDTQLFYNKGFNVIDGMLVEESGKYYLFLKDETLKPPEKNIRIATSDAFTGPYSDASAPITGEYWAEGPSCIKIGEYWYLYFDKYRQGRYGALRSMDLKIWEDISEQVHFPKGTRHGTAFKIPHAILEGLQE